MLSTRPYIKDLGILQGDVLLFGGAYSNLQAWDALKSLAETANFAPSNRIFTGDLIAYCAQSLAVVRSSRGLFEVQSILGNCEAQIKAGATDCGCGFENGTACDLASKVWFTRAWADLHREFPDPALLFKDTPDMLVFRHNGKRYVVIHGGFTDVARFIWPCSPESIFAEELAAIEHEIGSFDAVIAGHSGIAFERHIAGKQWINAGVIGMPPHDGRPETRYGVLSNDGVRFHNLSYDFEAAAQAMEDAGLTQGYETALRTGIWPSEDVLPPELRR